MPFDFGTLLLLSSQNIFPIEPISFIICLSEASSGSDAFALEMTAKASPDKSYYSLNGTKLWISNAKEAEVFLVFANVDLSLGYKGITAFMVDVNSEGITVGSSEKKLGLRASAEYLPSHI